jgi:membrane-associated phospholipid phosphatase
MKNKYYRLPNEKNLFSRLSEAFSEIYIEFIVALVFFIAAVGLFYILVHLIIPEKENLIDSLSFSYVKPWIKNSNTEMAVFVSYFGSGLFLLPAYFYIIYYLLSKGRKTYAIFVFTVSMSGLLLGLVLKELFQRPRPLHHMVSAGGYSFPSGHSLGGFFCCHRLVCLRLFTFYSGIQK